MLFILRSFLSAIQRDLLRIVRTGLMTATIRKILRLSIEALRRCWKNFIKLTYARLSKMQIYSRNQKRAMNMLIQSPAFLWSLILKPNLLSLQSIIFSRTFNSFFRDQILWTNIMKFLQLVHSTKVSWLPISIFLINFTFFMFINKKVTFKYHHTKK